ncbi:MAG: DUF3343 domain-containing protein [Firmicutes bacterium]|nr:DUF3343 domain-containing protein [Bacillota bacterium]
MTEESQNIRYYVLFANYEHGLAAHGILDAAGIENRIAPAPRAIQGELTCGMSLLLRPEHAEAAKACLDAQGAAYHAILPLADQLRARRDKYC